MKQLTSIIAIALFVAIYGVKSAAVAGGSVGSGVRLEAQMSGNTKAFGGAKYEERQKGNLLRRTFVVQAVGYTPGKELSVMLNGVQFATMTVDQLGVAQLQLSSDPIIETSGESTSGGGALPALKPGDTISVASLTGKFISM